MAKNTFTKVGTIWKGKPNKNNEEMPHSLRFAEGFVPNPKGFYQFHSKKWKEKDLEQKVAKGWVSPEQAEKAAYAISRMSDDVVADIIEVLKIEE